ncbi:acetyl-CoA C-acetyltransferase [Neobacillus drentensis]|uniref:acetyl-CoA C-acetyltransferase n=1 Tax=Neobacillus drentensis TaxID=220684 RepID=UPI000826B8EB
MNEVYIVAACRTAIGSFGGSLKDFSSSELGALVIKEAMNRSGVPSHRIDEVILGNVFKAGGKGNPARQASIKAGIHVSVPSLTIDKQCASGLRSIIMGYHQVALGEASLIVAGGTENMSRVPHLILDGRWGKAMGNLTTVDGLYYDGLHCAIEGYHMGITAENLVEKYRISREEQDEFALASQKKAASAIQNGKFEKEIVGIEVQRKKESFIFYKDEHPRGTSLDKLMNLKPAFKKDGTVTAGNTSGLNDGAAAVLLASKEMVQEFDLQPLAKIKAAASAGVEPSVMGLGPIPATIKALEKAHMSIEDLDLVELNEAFAAQCIAVNRELKIREDIINVNGGAIALGHPVGCSGARIIVTLVHELQRQKKEIGLASLCVGGGQGVSVIIEAM